MTQSLRFRNTCKLVLLVVFIVAVRLLYMLSSYTTSLMESSPHSNLTEQEFLYMDFDPSLNTDIDENASVNNETTKEMRGIIDSLRERVKREATGYQLPSGRLVEELIPERGGTPMRSLVVTTWRSGSTFLGSVLDSHPASFHYSEPLLEFKNAQVRGEPLGTPAVRALRDYFSCNYYVLERYLTQSKKDPYWFQYNTSLWKHCEKHKDICWLSQFLSPVCKLFPFQSMKVVRIRLRLIEELLADPKLNLRVVLLVRDPRGTMRSRSKLKWCNEIADCSDPVRLCADLVDDYGAALRFSQLFPDKFKVVRYEEMSLKPFEVIPDMFEFFGLQYHEDVDTFLKIHTTKPDKDIYSTFRNSSKQALLWRSLSEPTKIQELQVTCRMAMDAWGYLPAHNATHQLSFNPLVQPFHLP